MILDWFILFLQIMLINIVLSGDNAVVIALASKNLPLHQRKQAIWWGAFGAVVLRLVLTVVAVYLLHIPYIQAFGSLLLMWIAIKLLIDEEGHADVKQATNLFGAIWTIIVADFVMSLDNVLAIAAKANGNIPVIVLGITLSIPIIIWGSTMVMMLLNKFPIFVYLGAGILGYTAGEMLMHDKKVVEMLFNNIPGWVIPVTATVIVLAAGIIKKLIPTKTAEGKHQE